METFFVQFLKMNITVCWLVAAVLVLRLCIKKAPKWMRGILWAVIGIRLLIPFPIESPFSLIMTEVPLSVSNSSSTIADSCDTTYDYNTSPETILESETISDTTAVLHKPALSITAISIKHIMILWSMGTAFMLIYSLINIIRLHRRLSVSLKSEKQVRICDDIPSAFIFGIIKPTIYLPSFLTDEQIHYVMAHEKAHLSRFDHIWKPLSYLLLSIYWFNPCVWAAYILMCRDIELAADEKVINKLSHREIKAYSTSLLTLSLPRHISLAYPLAFGEIGVKERIKSIASYKKTSRFITFVCSVACIMISIGFFANPKSQAEALIKDEQTVNFANDNSFEPESLPNESIYSEPVTENVLSNSDFIISETNAVNYTYTEINQAMYTKQALNIRSGPNSDFEVIDVLSPAAEVTVLSQCLETGWYKIAYKNNENAFVHSSYLVDTKPIINTIEPSSEALVYENQYNKNYADNYDMEMSSEDIDQTTESSELKMYSIEDIHETINEEQLQDFLIRLMRPKDYYNDTVYHTEPASTEPTTIVIFDEIIPRHN